MAYLRGNKAITAVLLDTSKKRGLNLEAIENKVRDQLTRHGVLIYILMMQNGKRPPEMEEEGKAILLSVFGVQ